VLTARGWFVLTVAVVASALGLLVASGRSTTVPILGLTLLVWFVAAWIGFAARYRSAVGRPDVTRVLLQGGREVSTAWTKVPCRVRVVVTPRGGLRGPLVFAEDRLPVGQAVAEGSNTYAGELGSDTPGVIEYGLRPDGPGVLRFEGVALRVTDQCGFFYRRTFIRSRTEYLVLPQLADDEGRQRADKRFNTLPPPGVHRLRRPGGGSELLDLRDYRPGDPPKMIAWKASARRDRLITKEFESDVPVRTVLFLDISQASRVGPPGRTPVARLVDVTAAVAQAAAGNRDLVGLTTFDEQATSVLRPARTQAHTVRLLGRLAEAAALLPDHSPGSAAALLKAADPVAREMYPDLLADDLNSRPLGMHWIPLLDSRWGWLIFVPLVLAPVLAVQARWFNACVEFVNDVRPRFNVLPLDAGVFFVLIALVLFLPSVLAGLFWVIYGIRGFFEPRRSRTSRRKQLAAVFAALDGDTPGAVERYLKDDTAFADRAGRFLADHRILLPTGDGDRRANSDPARKVDVLAAALLRSVLAARDNELYVILADLTDVAEDTDSLVQAVRVARARHHHVLVIVPWPDGLPPPAEPGGRKRPVARPVAAGKRGRLRIAQLVQAGLIRQYHRRFARLRSDLTRVGASVLRLPDDAPVRVVLDRLDRLRGVRTRR
jgi:uncharacterized protein (DUF58 family)